MDTLEGLARRLDTTEDLRGIVGTMKLLAAVSIRQYEQAADALASYSDTVERGLKAVLLHRGWVPEAAHAASADGPAGLVVFGSDHGLCGRFNAEIVDAALGHAGESGAGSRWLAVGARAADRLGAGGVTAERTLTLPGSADGLVETAYEVIEEVESWQAEGVRRVDILHNRRGARTPAEPTTVPMLPLDSAWLHRLGREPWPERGLPTHRAPPEALFASLVRQHLFVVVFRAAADSLASEHASRLASMQAAERNIDERLDELRGAYRRRRQQSITEELLDVVSGFEALGGEAEEASEDEDAGERPR